jgi:hypothetical protein
MAGTTESITRERDHEYLYEGSGKVQGRFREGSGKVQGRALEEREGPRVPIRKVPAVISKTRRDHK